MDYCDIHHVNITIKDDDAKKTIDKTRVKFKLYSEKSITANKKDLEHMHSLWIDLMGNYNDFGTTSISNKFIGNTLLDSYYMKEFVDIKKIDADETKKSTELFGFSMGRLLISTFKKFSLKENECILNPTVMQIVTKDFSLKQDNNALFNSKNSKYISLILFNILCSINFVLYFLNKFFSKDNEFYFRVKFNCYNSSVISLKKLINYSEQNPAEKTIIRNYISDIERLESLKQSIKGSEFRNCMAHYKISEASIEKENILKDVPFYGLIEKYTNKDYYQLNDLIEQNLTDMSALLENLVLSI